MGRPAKGSVAWNTRTSTWEVRVTLRDGERSKPVPMTGLAPCIVAPSEPTKGCACISCMAAYESGQLEERLRILEAENNTLRNLLDEKEVDHL